jgi:ATP-binding cassette, subfamily B, multidrug efflux pump
MNTFKTLNKEFLENRRQIFVGLAALIVVDILQLIIPRVVKYAIDDLTSGAISSSRLLLYAAEILALGLGIGGFRYVWRFLLLGSSRRIERSLRNHLFIHLQTLSPSYFQKTRVGDLMAHATNDVEAVRMAIAMGMVFLVDTLILGVMTISFMVYIHPLLTLLSLLPMPLITVTTFLFSRMIHHRFEMVQGSFASLTERVREAITGVRVIRAYVQEEYEKEKLSQLSRDYVQKNVSVTKASGMFLPFVLFLSNLSMAIVLYEGGRLTIFQTITPGDFVAFMSYLGIFAWPMMALGWSINVVQRGKASMGRLNRVFAEVPEIPDAKGDGIPEKLRGRIEARGLCFFSRNGDNPLLQGIDLAIEEGEKVAIVGRTGSGKTILSSLIMRLLESPAGSLFIGGIEIHRLPLRVLRGSIGYVPQETFLFSATIRENIVFGKTEATDNEVEKVVRLAQLQEDIQSFPEGLDTMVGERGVTLSGGQRQRVAIARAILMDPSILLLDDALSSVDIQTEERILDGMGKSLREKTIILITHRIAPLRRADRIVVLDEGKVAEMGEHSSLLAKGGIYADLYWRSQLEEEVERDSNRK